MKIHRLKIEGFRSLRQVEWTPGDLNVIIGPNGSGKSNLLLALELLSESAAGQLGQFVRRVGGMGTLAWDGKGDPITFVLTTDGVSSVQQLACFKYELHLNRIWQSDNFVIGHELLDTLPVNQDPSKETVRLFRDLSRSELWDDESQKFRSLNKRVVETESLLSEVSGPLAISTESEDFQSQIVKWRFYQDFRTDREAPVRQPTLWFSTGSSAFG